MDKILQPIESDDGWGPANHFLASYQPRCHCVPPVTVIVGFLTWTTSHASSILWFLLRWLKIGQLQCSTSVRRKDSPNQYLWNTPLDWIGFRDAGGNLVFSILLPHRGSTVLEKSIRRREIHRYLVSQPERNDTVTILNVHFLATTALSSNHSICILIQYE